MKRQLSWFILAAILPVLASGCDISGGEASTVSTSASDSSQCTAMTSSYRETYSYNDAAGNFYSGPVGTPAGSDAASTCEDTSYSGTIQSVEFVTSGADSGKLAIVLGLLPSGRFPQLIRLVYNLEVQFPEVDSEVQFACSIDSTSITEATETVLCTPTIPLALTNDYLTYSQIMTQALQALVLFDEDPNTHASCLHGFSVVTTQETGACNVSSITPTQYLGFPALIGGGL